jgi:hypothetical protein
VASDFEAKAMVLLERIELSASPLPRVCSTTELQQRDHRLAGNTAGLGAGAPSQRHRPLSSIRRRGKRRSMAAGNDPETREERLAAKLRENLRRRKAQARALDEQGAALPKGEPGR